MRIVGVEKTGLDWTSGRSRSEQSIPAPETSEAPGRALVLHASASAHPERPHPDVRSVAAFLAQLIATARRAPQTRERRRGTIQEAVAGYTVAAAAPKIRATLSRSV